MEKQTMRISFMVEESARERLKDGPITIEFPVESLKSVAEEELVKQNENLRELNNILIKQISKSVVQNQQGDLLE